MAVKFQFVHQDFQAHAVSAVRDVFAGQIKGKKTFFENTGDSLQLTIQKNFLVHANNPVVVSDSEVLANLQHVQERNGLEISQALDGKFNLTVEMETGTGKTYTYIRTIYELSRAYGWNKFIVVVPSIAIREGVLKTFQIAEEHFASEFGTRADYFAYDSKNLARLQGFAEQDGISVMIINSQSFNARETRRISIESDSCMGRKPLELLAGTKPIMIIDEPQSVEGPRTRESMKEFSPLFTLRYSATPRETYNMVYKLNAKQAYEKGYVKKIRVTGFNMMSVSASEGYVYLKGIIKSEHNPVALMEFDVRTAQGIKRITRRVSESSDLYDLSGNLEEYRHGFIVNVIDGLNGSVEFLNGQKIFAGEIIGASSEAELRRLQIRETIEAHLQKESELFAKGIKVLSLFFIDEVAKYRLYDSEGTAKNGIYAKIFEEEYLQAVKNFLAENSSEKYSGYLESIDAKKTHAGYFSVDKHNRMTDGQDDDVDAFDLIMRDKERLLNIGEPVRFIFSHSALKEGWDNPNVFQICTLKNSASSIRKRQEVGRGLRLAVNQEGFRVTGEGINELTVIASESYKEFSEALQSEINEVSGNDEKPIVINDTRNSGAEIHLNEERMNSPEFLALWERISRKSIYHVDFDEKELIDKSAREINNELAVPGTVMNVISGVLNDELIFSRDTAHAKVITVIESNVHYDLVGRLAYLTGLTRKIIVGIMRKILPEKFSRFSANPEVFISHAAKLINDVKGGLISERISYIPLDEFYSTDIFMPKRTIPETSAQKTTRHGLYDAVQCDSEVERRFSRELDESSDVNIFTKLPEEFAITTPAGNYTPDWAAVFRSSSYVVAETKGETLSSSLRGEEKAKRDCARAHFSALHSDVKYDMVSSYEDLTAKLI